MLAAFMHPGLFWGGLGAASVPVIIHLLNRRRFKVLEWAAMRFIRESIRKNRRRLRLEELLLLLLRCLAVFLLAVAVGRFVGCKSPGGTRAQTTHVFLLDDSASMGQKIADTTAFTKAASDLAEMLKEISSSDKVAVVLTSRPERAKGVEQIGRLTDAETLVQPVKSLTVSDTAGQLHLALRTVSEFFGEEETKRTKKRLYVLSDFRNVDYASGGNLEAIRKQFKTLRDGEVAVTLMSYGTPPGLNLTAEAIEVLDKLAIATVSVRVQLRVRNNGPEPVTDVAVRFSARTGADEEPELPAKKIPTIDPGASELVQVSCVFPDEGGAALVAELPGDSLAGDNAAHLALAVRSARKVLIVDGEPDVANPEQAESFYLTYALDPTGDRGYGNEVDVVSADDLTEVSFESYDAVILANVSDLLSGQVEALDKYVRAGGGLAIFTGDRVDRDFYNDRLYQAGAGLCPVRIGLAAGDAKRRQSYVRLLRGSIQNEPVTRSFLIQQEAFTQLVRFYAYTLVEQTADVAAGDFGPARVLARFDNADTTPRHSPAIVARTYGEGVVVMVLSSADKEWTDWPKDFTFVTFVNDMLEYISRPTAQKGTDLVGKEIVHSVGGRLAAARVSLQPPAAAAEGPAELEERQDGASRVFVYKDTRSAGIYQLKLELPTRQDEAEPSRQLQTVMFARNVDPMEGRLEVAGEAELRGYLAVEFHYKNQLKAAKAGQEDTVTRQTEYWKAALALMLVVLAVEVFLGQRFGHYR